MVDWYELSEDVRRVIEKDLTPVVGAVAAPEIA
jgi:hypothetical protein